MHHTGLYCGPVPATLPAHLHLSGNKKLAPGGCIKPSHIELLYPLFSPTNNLIHYARLTKYCDVVNIIFWASADIEVNVKHTGNISSKDAATTWSGYQGVAGDANNEYGDSHERCQPD